MKADLTDPEDFDVSSAGIVRGQRARLLRKIRRTTGLSQKAFSERLRVPVRTLQQWEQARATAPEIAVAFACVLANEPEAVERALA